MQHKNTEHITIIQNPNSTNYREVEDKVLRPLYDANVPFNVYETQYPDARDNIDAMSRDLPAKGIFINAAGDGTANQLVNATIAGKKDVALGFLPFGNFNDIANTHMDVKRQTVLDLIGAPTKDRYPLSLDINGEYWRDVSAYVTLGLTARIAAGFDDEASREKMKKASKTERQIKRLGQAAADYIRYRTQKMPAFKVNGGDVVTDSTDIAIANNSVIAGMIRPAESYYDTLAFGARADLNMANIFKATSFGLQSLAGRSPLERFDTMKIDFQQAASVAAQADGEYEVLPGVRDIFVYKDPAKKLRVLHARN